MTKEEAKSCIGTIEMLQRLAYNIHGVMDVIDADNCNKIIKSLEQEPCDDATLKDIFCTGCEYKEQEPCEDCISREKVLMEIDKYLCGVPFDEKGIDEVIKELPSNTPQPKVGEWLKNGELCKCSRCGSNVLFSAVKLYNFCYRCGAKMI